MAAKSTRKPRAFSRGRIAPNPTIARLGRSPKAPPENVQRFTGYFGPSTAPDTIRLYLSLGDLSTYVEIPKKQIVHAEKVPESIMEGEAFHVWVRQDAMLTVVTRRPAALVGGDISSRMRAGGESSYGYACAGTRGTCPPPLAPTLECPTVLCPTALGCFIDSSRKLFETLKGRG